MIGKVKMCTSVMPILIFFANLFLHLFYLFFVPALTAALGILISEKRATSGVTFRDSAEAATTFVCLD